jgi:hypothetical protein
MHEKRRFNWNLAMIPTLEVAVEIFNGHEGILCRGLHGDPELTFLLAKLEGNPFQDFGNSPRILSEMCQQETETSVLEIIPFWGNKSKARGRE